MILEQHVPHYNRLRNLGAYRSPMLMLGQQEVRLGVPMEAKAFFGVESYTTLDPDGGDIRWDLGETDWGGRFATVMNLGTLEHIWDAHQAWSSALRMVLKDGVFITVSPVGGWENHGIHITDERFIRAFIQLNGFAISDYWLTRSNGEVIGAVERNNGDQLLWLLAEKREDVAEFSKPQQVFRDGQPLERIGT